MARRPRYKLDQTDLLILEAARELPVCRPLFNRDRRSEVFDVTLLGKMAKAVARDLEDEVTLDDICHGFAKLSAAGEISLW